MSQFRSLAVQLLVKYFDRRILSHPVAGQERKVIPKLREQMLNGETMLQAVALSAACVVHSSSGPHKLVDCKPLRQLAIDVGESLRSSISEILSESSRPPHFQFRPLPYMYMLLADHLTARQRRTWQATMKQYIGAARQYMELKRKSWGMPGPFTGTGPNHLFGIAGSMASAAKVMGDSESLSFTRRCFRQLIKLQGVEGYFCEYTGPVIGYQTVYAHGLGDAVWATGDKALRASLEHLTEFRTRAMYPSLGMIETMDQRNRSRGAINYTGYSCIWTDIGRSVALAALKANESKIETGSPLRFAGLSSVLTIAALHCPDGPAKTVPVTRKTHHDSFDSMATMGRKSGWFHVLSGYHEPPAPYNPYLLDRTQNLSIFHDSCGLIVGGGNDKNAPETATLELLETGEVYYFPAISAKAHGSVSRGKLHLDYGPGVGDLSTKVISPEVLELTASIQTTFTGQRNRLNLQLPLNASAELQVDGKSITLDTHAEPMQYWTVKKTLSMVGKWTIETDGTAELRWPHLPHSCYGGRPNRGSMSSAVAFLSLELDGGGKSRTVRFRVPAQK